MVYFQEKMVDRDALCPINLMSYKLNQLQHRPDKCSKFQFLHPKNVKFYQLKHKLEKCS